MRVEKKDLAKSQIELIVELTVNEFKPYIERGAQKVSREVKIEGFRPGKVPYDVLKQKIGEMTILEEAARIAINKTLEQVIREQVVGQPVGQPQVNITKLAPDNPMEYKVVLAMLPEVTLGDYKKAKVKLDKVEVEMEEVEKMIKQLQEFKVQETLATREARDGDKVIVDIEMFLDKVPVEGGQGKGTGVIIGRGYIVPGFGKKLIGAKRGETREFNLPYPADHYQQNLAGKLVEFKVKLKEIYQRDLPAVDLNFARSFGLNSVDDFKNNIKKSINQEKQRDAEQKAEIKMLDKIMEKTKFSDLPEMLINNEADTMMRELEAGVVNQGGKFDDYLNHLKKTREQLVLEMLPDAVKRVKISLLIRKIGQAEKIKVGDKEVEEEVARLLEQYKDDKQENKSRIKSTEFKAYLKNMLAGRKVIAKLKEWNVEK